jgi:uncharacterized protein (DUF1501 family)
MQTLTRRNFIKMAALPVVAWPQWMPRLAFAPPHTTPRGDILVCVFLRGAADGLNMIVPHGDDIYYAQRPTVAIPLPTMPEPEQASAPWISTVFLDCTRPWRRCCPSGKPDTWLRSMPSARPMSPARISKQWN